MNTKHKSLIAIMLGAIALSASVTLAVAPGLIFTNLRGIVHVSQGVPCGGPLDLTTTIADGRMDITPTLAPPADTTGGGLGAQFDLTRLDLFLTPLTVQHECLGFNATVEFHNVGLQLVKGVRFTGVPIVDEGPEERKYRFTIPRSQVLLFEAVTDNLPVPQPQRRYQRPGEDVTGVIDLRRGTASLHVVLFERVHFFAGCVHKKCAIDQTFGGREIADLTGMAISPRTDTDSDGVPDLTDNCPLVANPRQELVPAVQFEQLPPIFVSSCAVGKIHFATATDVCRARPVNVAAQLPPLFAVGNNLIILQANDGIDRPVTAQQNVIVSAADHMPPAVSCTAGKSPQAFTVNVSDDCAGDGSVKLGSFNLVNGETIQIEQTGKPGVRLINTTSKNDIKHFLVGKGEAMIVATDASGNVGRAACK